MVLRRRRNRLLILAMLFILGLAGVLVRRGRLQLVRDYILPPLSSEKSVQLIRSPRTAADKIVNGAKMEVLRGVDHDGSYVKIDYPGGDVPEHQGACTDVVVRALRNGGYDLQKLIHDDKLSSPNSYPKYPGPSVDANIDHRRVPNQMVFFRRHGRELTKSVDGPALATWKPGDIIYWKLDNNLDHCGVVSNDNNADGTPLVIHNIGTARQADRLDTWRIIGHFRYPAGSR